MEDCLVCGRIEAIKKGNNPYFVRELRMEKLNYELLGVGNAVHMHWHLFPRKEGDTPMSGPVWKLDKSEMYNEKYRPTEEELNRLKEKLSNELEKLL